MDESDLQSREGTSSRPESPVDRLLFAALAIVVPVFVGTVLAQDPDLSRRLVGGAIVAVYEVGIYFLDPASFRSFLRTLSRIPRAVRDRIRGIRPPVRVAAMAAVVVLVAVGFVASRPGPPRPTLPFCGEPTQVSLLTTPEELDAARELAARYTADLTAARADGCPTASMYVYAGTTDTVAAALAHGWQDYGNDAVPSRDVGPAPDLYLADSTADVARILRLADDAQLERPDIAADGVVAYSPVVLGAFTPHLPAGLDPRGRARWADLLADADQLGGIVRADPRGSAGPALGTLAMYLSEGWRPGDAPGSVASLRAAEQRVAASLNAIGANPVDGTAELLCRIADSDGARPAVVATEQALLRFQQHGAADCSGNQQAPLFVYPSDTLLVEHPLVRFGWSGAAAGRVAAGFADWLGGAQGRQSLVGVGLRPATGTSLMGSDRSGPLPSAPPHRRDVPAPATSTRAPDSACVAGRSAAGTDGSALRFGTTCAFSTYLAAQVPGRVLLAVDTSGSMGEEVGPERTRAQVVAGAVSRSLDQIGPRDGFGVWTFPGDTRGHGHRTLVPFGSGSASRRSTVAPALTGQSPAGNTPLYQTIADAVRSPDLRGGGANARTALVVLTDGEDTSSPHGLNPTAVRQAAVRAGVRVFAVAVGEASCVPGSPLVQISAGHCYTTDFEHVDDVLHQLFSMLWGGR